ncbi:MAG: TonB-dependent receptor [Xanthomonadaceae bacterium]|nr:TonB-dependent receptor [Xanthomonadaceae bacterium]MDP2186595.1 TonB-dependent receptor [Xanthomonadales bacterium]MDZ4115116.1 TonB-dependent receptor [Xanthomonadaceae bacterium]MDZ4377866.1 TonB-dependent receptor [Xanthomonadaceae bacterium]
MNLFRRSRLSAAVSSALLLGALPLVALAQETSQDNAKTLDRVEVTGSRIKKAELEGLSPVQIITRADIDRAGLTSIGDVLQQITASGSGLNTKFNSSGNFGFPPDGGGVGAGSTTVDLRHLGAKRVLVLVDGLRWVSESSASGVSTATDLNTIPMAIVDHIEVLEDGASSLYGSDAIAGVVNIITKKNFEGAQIDASWGAFDGKDGETKTADLTWGAQTDKARFMLAASYNKSDAISSNSTEQSRFPVPGTGLNFGSSATPNGRFIFVDPRCPLTDIDDDPSTPPVTFCSITTPNGSSFPNGPVFTGGNDDDFIPFVTPDNRFNFAEFNLLLTPSERKSVFTSVDYDISERVRWKTKFLYNNRQSTNQAAPEPIFLGPDAGTGNPLADNITISASNPFNPFGVDLGPDNLILVGRRPIEGGPRIFKQDVDTWYFSTGLEGDFDIGDRVFYWDVNAVRSENKADQTTFGSYNIAHIAQGLGPVANCTGSCVPLNIFGGPGTLTPEMLRFIGANLTDKSENNLTLWSANLSGDLFELPAGAVSFAAGYEYRKNNGSFQPDALIVAGESNGVPSLPTRGTIEVNEFFGELNIPLLADVAFAKRLDLNVATRYSDYDTSGGTTNNKVGLRWQVSDEFLIRGTFAEGLRAPSVGELFGSASRFDATLTDPCLISVSGRPPTGNAANCAALGVPAGAAQAGTQISVTTGGNTELNPETSDSYSAGFVWSPGFASNTWWSERVDYEVTWYRHELTGAIQANDAQTQLNLCVATLDPQFCDGITRANTGGINGFTNKLINLGSITTEGYDFKFNWLLPDTSFGQFGVNWSTTYVDSFKSVGTGGAVQPRKVGVEVNDSAIPEITSNLALTWHKDAFSASWVMRYIDDLTEDCEDAADPDFGVCSDSFVARLDDKGRPVFAGTNHLGSVVYHDFQASWNADYLGGFKVSVGVNNVFDKQAPNCLSCSLNGFDASTYDLVGQYVYGRVQLNF